MSDKEEDEYNEYHNRLLLWKHTKGPVQWAHVSYGTMTCLATMSTCARRVDQDVDTDRDIVQVHWLGT